MNTYISLPSAMVDFDSIIAHDETVACRNATVIINQHGEVTAWFDNDKPVIIIKKGEND